jgi:hypothetical protein
MLPAASSSGTQNALNQEVEVVGEDELRAFLSDTLYTPGTRGLKLLIYEALSYECMRCVRFSATLSTPTYIHTHIYVRVYIYTHTHIHICIPLVPGV